MEFLEYLDEEIKHTYNPDDSKSKFKIKDIFNDHWYSFLEDNPDLTIRPVVHEEVEKMMGCGSLSNGYAVYSCKHCNNYFFGKQNFKSLKNYVYKTSSNGFYVHAPKINARDIKSTVKYVIRYSGKSAMAQSRILNYDGEFVTFWYDRHEDNHRVEETIHAYEFIKRLIIHIYDKYFNVVRYYGLYAKKHRHSSKFNHMLKSHVAEFRKKLKNWRCRIELYFLHDPLLCSCGNYMSFIDIFCLKRVACSSPWLYNSSMWGVYMDDVNDLRRKYMDNPPEGYTTVERASKYEKERKSIMYENRELKEKCENMEKDYSVKLKEEIRKVENKYEDEIYQLKKENSFLRRVINTFQKTVDKFIHWVCNKFSLSSEEEFIRDFQIENDIYLDPQKQIEYEEELEYEEMEW